MDPQHPALHQRQSSFDPGRTGGGGTDPWVFGVKEEAHDTLSLSSYGYHSQQSSIASSLSVSEADVGPLPAGWSMAKTPEGQTYFIEYVGCRPRLIHWV